MNRKFSLIIIVLIIQIFCNISFVNAQIDILQTPGVSEKKNIKSILFNYNTFVNYLCDTNASNQKKAATGKFIRENLTGPSIFVFDDIDSITKPDTEIPFLKYVQKITDTSNGNLTITIDTSKIYIDKIKYDKIRRYHFVEAKTIKTFNWVFIVKKIKTDTTLVNDSIMRYDTIKFNYNQKLNFLVRFDKENNAYKNFKIVSISKTGIPHKLEPLPPLVTWWISLDPEWKKILNKKLKLEEYPTNFDLEKLTNQSELDISNSLISSLEPLSKFTNLDKFLATNTKVNSLIPIQSLPRLRILDISKTKIDTLIGLEKFISLEEFRCVGNKLEGIEEVRSLKNLIEFDCSDNDIFDISPVKELINLKELSFSLNIKIKNVDAIKELVNLEWLAMGKIDLKNLSPLKNLINLVHLDLFNTNVTNLEPIRDLSKIIYLNLNHNKMQSLDAIKNYKFLVELHLSSSSIKDLSEIRNFNFIRVLDISNTLIPDLGPVHKFEDIKVLKAQFTKIGKDEIQRFKKNHPNCQITYY